MLRLGFVAHVKARFVTCDGLVLQAGPSDKRCQHKLLCSLSNEIHKYSDLSSRCQASTSSSSCFSTSYSLELSESTKIESEE